MCSSVTFGCNGARQFEPHQRAELEAVTRAGRHHPAFGAGLLDHEPLVVRDGIEAGLEAIGAPGGEVLEQPTATFEQWPDLLFGRVPTAVRVARETESVVADLEAPAFHRRHEV